MGAMYEERVISRMMDCRITTAIEFYGRDLRLMKGCRIWQDRRCAAR